MFLRGGYTKALDFDLGVVTETGHARRGLLFYTKQSNKASRQVQL